MAILEAAGGRVSDMLSDDAMWVGAPIVASTPALYPVLVDLVGFGTDGAA